MAILFDSHAHTSDLSYCCAPGITPETYLRVLESRPDLDGIAITNHGFATYFPERTAWAAAYMRNPCLFDGFKRYGNRRLETHLQQVEPLRQFGVYTGFEVEMMGDGRLTVDDKFRARLDVLIGSVHFFPEFDQGAMHREEIVPAWWAHTERLMQTGIDILGHPFRWLRRTAKQTVTAEMIPQLVALAKRNRVALEINAHMCVGNDVLLVKECVKTGVLLALGTDSHTVAEIGNLEYPVAVIQAAGYTLDEVRLWKPKNFTARHGQRAGDGHGAVTPSVPRHAS